MKKGFTKALAVLATASMSVGMLAGCGNTSTSSEAAKVETDDISFPLAEKVTITGMISYPVGTE